MITSTALIFVVGVCLGTVLTAILMSIATYSDYVSTKRDKKGVYTCLCDTHDDAYELIKILSEYGAEDLNLYSYTDNTYRVNYKTTADKACKIITEWMMVDEI